MVDLNKNVDKLVEALISKEKELISMANFCSEHNFKKEEEWLRMKHKVVNEIRFEVELLKTKSNSEYRPRLYFF